MTDVKSFLAPGHVLADPVLLTDLPFRPPLDAPSERPVMGIDPGITGGIAWLYGSGRIVAMDIPTAAGEVDPKTVERHVKHAAPRFAIIERAQAMPRQGVSSTFKYGLAYGTLRTVCALCDIPYALVTPGKWKNHFKLDADKEKARALAIRLWPGSSALFERKKDHGRAEAALIARYGIEAGLVP